MGNLSKTVKVSVDAETLAALERQAAKADRSVASVARLAIRDYLNRKDNAS